MPIPEPYIPRLYVNVRRCVLCRTPPGEMHGNGCAYPERAADGHRDIASVTRLSTSPGEARAEEALEAANLRALETWIRMGRLL